MTRLAPTSSRIVAEVIDGEAIILDLRNGVYYGTDGLGAVAWSAAVDGWTAQEIADAAAASYPSVPTARDDVLALLDALVGADLLAPSAADQPVSTQSIVWPARYAKPELERHDNLKDMMELDPLHDTSAAGWPMPAPDHR